MKRMKNLSRAIAFVVLMAFAAINLTGCDASAITGMIQKIIPIITQVIGAIKGIAGGAKAANPGTASGTAAIGVGTKAATPPATTNTATVKEGDDAEGLPNSDKE